jgi:hypothetical protein
MAGQFDTNAMDDIIVSVLSNDRCDLGLSNHESIFVGCQLDLIFAPYLCRRSNRIVLSQLFF